MQLRRPTWSVLPLLVGLAAPSTVSAQWLPNKFESQAPLSADTTSVARAQPTSDVIVRNAVVGGVLGAGIALAVWSLACRGKQEGGCESKWGLISAGFGAVTGSITGIVATLAPADDGQQQVGLTLGVNIASGTNTRTGLNVGAVGVLSIVPNIGLQAEVTYSQKGVMFRHPVLGGAFKFSYIDIPVLLQWGIPVSKTGGAKVVILAGPALGLKLSCRLRVTHGGDFSIDSPCDGPPISNQTNALDLALVFGGGVDFPVGEGVVGLQARYGFGVTKVATFSSNHPVFTVLGQYRFALR